MGGKKLIWCSYILTTVLFVPLNVASEHKCLQNGLYEHPTDCTKFYSCAPSGPVLMHCPTGLHFNPEYLVCDLPQKAGCKGSSSDNEGTNSHLSCPIYPDSSDCTKFYLCSSLGPLSMNCPVTLHFNPRLLLCDYPQNAGCSSTANTYPVTTTKKPVTHPEIIFPVDNEIYSEDISILNLSKTTETTLNTEHQSDIDQSTETISSTENSKININSSGALSTPAACKNTIWSHPNDCTKFFMCSSIGALEIVCPEQLHFNPVLLVCDWPHNAGCKEYSTVKPEITTTNITEIGLEVSSTNSNYEDHLNFDTNTTNFSASTDDIPIEESEITIMEHLDTTTTEKLSISAEENVQVEIISTTQSLETTLATTLFPKLNGTELCKSNIWPHPDDCTKFFMCASTGVVEMFCPEKLHFNAVRLVCDWPYSAECKVSLTVAPQISTTEVSVDSSPKNELEVSSTYTNYLNELSTEATTTDFSGIPTTKHSLESTALEYLEIIKMEATSENVPRTTFTAEEITSAELISNTSQSLEATSTDSKTKLPGLNFNSTELCKSNIWPHPENCTKFFMCGSTGVVEMLCPEEMNFNPEMLVCDWPHNAGCQELLNVETVITTSEFAEYSSKENRVEPLSTNANLSDDLPSDSTTTVTTTDYSEIETTEHTSTLNNSTDYFEITMEDLNTTTTENVLTQTDGSTKNTIYSTLTTEEQTTELTGTTTQSLDINLTETVNSSSMLLNFNSTELCKSNIWPHPENCTKFFICGSTGVVEMLCPEEMNFNPELLVCDWPHHAGCQELLNVATVITTTEFAEDSSKENRVELLSTNANLSDDLPTNNSTTTVTTTDYSEIETTEHTSTVTNSMDYLKITTMENLNTTTTENVLTQTDGSTKNTIYSTITTEEQTTELTGTTTQSLDKNRTETINSASMLLNFNSTGLCKSNIWPHPDNCTKFFMCGSSGAIEVLCPEGLHFNPILLVCDWPYKAGCKEYLNVLLEISITEHIPASTNSKNYLKVTTRGDLDETSNENLPLSTSDMHTETTTYSTLTTEEETSNKPDVTAIQNLETSSKLCENHIWPHPNDCTKFFMCYSSGIIEYFCPEGLHFNPEFLFCDWPENLSCKSEFMPNFSAEDTLVENSDPKELMEVIAE